MKTKSTITLLVQLVASFGATPAFPAEVATKTSTLTTPFYRNWGLYQANGNASISLPEALKLNSGSRSVKVAIVDTGIDGNHPDLKANLMSSNNFGFDFVTNKKNPIDPHGHGTHIAGIIGAVANPATGASGVAQKVSLMAVRYFSEANEPGVNMTNTIKALRYAIDNGAQIINYSGGGPSFSKEEFEEMKRAETKGILVVCAAGNEGQNTDSLHSYYPANYGKKFGLKNIIAVTATNQQNQVLASSNWGKESVDVAAPGEKINSTLPDGKYGEMTGTSQATAFVSGLAALILSENPNLKPEEVRKIIMNSVDKFETLKEKVASGGRINAYKALAEVKASKAMAPKDGSPTAVKLVRKASERDLSSQLIFAE